MLQRTAPASALLRSFQVAPVWFLAAMISAGSAPFALPLLAIGVAWSAWRGDLDLAGHFDALEWGGIVFIAAWALALAIGIDPLQSLRLSIPLLVAATCLFTLRRQREPAAAVAAFDAALFLLAFWQCLQLVRPLLAGLGGEAAIRAADALWLVEPNDIAWKACAWPPLLAWRLERTARVLIFVPIILALLLMIALGSRLALITAVLALAPMLESAPRRTLGVAAGLAAVLMLAALCIDPAIFAKGSTSLASRWQLWSAAAKLFVDYPWAGAGPFGFPLGYLRYLPESIAIDTRATPWPHSLPLEVAAGMGLIGIAAAALLLVAVVVQYRGARPAAADRRVIAVQCTVFAMLALFEASFLRLWVWMLAVSILCRLPRIAAARSSIGEQQS